MFRLLPILFISAILIACSSDDSSSLKEWLNDQGIAASYGKEYFETDVSISGVKAGFDSSAFMVSSFAALGNVNALEHVLYFGLVAHDSIKSTWTLRTDSLFYGIFYKDKFPLAEEISARLYWRQNDSFEPDSSWLKFEKKWDDSTDASTDIVFNWQARSALDSFTISLPQKLLKAYPKPDSLNLLLGLKLISKDIVLRIAPPRQSNIEGLVRVGQKSRALEICDACLYAGVMDSVNINLCISEALKPFDEFNETVVFAQLVFPKTDEETNSEFELPIPIYIYNEKGVENYRVDTAHVLEYGHPNLLFWNGKNDSLEFQVTTALRRYVATSNLQAKLLPAFPACFGRLDFTLRFGLPMLIPKSFYLYNPSYSQERVFAANPDYAKYDFAYLKGKNAKLKIWYAKTDLD